MNRKVTEVFSPQITQTCTDEGQMDDCLYG